MSPRPATIPDWKLERLLLGELPHHEQEALQRQVEGDPELGARLQALRDSNARILTDHPPARVASEVARRAAAGRAEPRGATWHWSLLVAAPALAAAAALLLWIGPTGDADPTRAPGGGLEQTRDKGLRPHLQVHRQQGGGSEQLADGDRAAVGDLLMLYAVGAGAGYGAVFSIDGRGTVTAHLPEAGEQAVALPRTGELALPHAYELDDAPGYERFILITGAQPFALAPLRQALDDLAATAAASTAPLHLPAALQQASLVLRKEGS